jgi:hypothetical protein
MKSIIRDWGRGGQREEIRFYCVMYITSNLHSCVLLLSLDVAKAEKIAMNNSSESISPERQQF